MPSRWDHLFDQKPVPLREHLFEEVSKRLAAELSRWPLPVMEVEPEQGKAFAELLTEPGAPPPAAAYEEAFRISRWDLEREVLAIDAYMRNRRWLERGLAPEHQRVILLISRWLLEQLLALREETHSRVTRAELVDILSRIERRWRNPEA